MKSIVRVVLATLLLTLLFGPSARASIAHDHSGAAASASSVTSFTETVTTSANAGVVMYFDIPATTNTISGISGGGTWVKAYQSFQSGGTINSDLEVWYLYTASALSSQTVTVTLNASNSSACCATWSSFTGTNTTVVEAVTESTKSSASNPWTASVTTLTNNALTASFYVTPNSTGGFSGGTGYTSGTVNTTYGSTRFQGDEYANAVTATAGSVSVPFAFSGPPSANGYQLAVSIAPAGGGGGSPMQHGGYWFPGM